MDENKTEEIKKKRGRFVKGQSGNPKGRPARDLTLAHVQPIALSEAGLELVQALGGQLRALRQKGETQELAPVEREWLLSLADRLIAMEETRGRLLLAALDLRLPDSHKAKLIDLFSDGPPRQLPAAESSKP